MNLKEKSVLIIVGLVLIMIVSFKIAKVVFCSHDSSVGDVALPLAKVIVAHIEKEGAPGNLKDLKGIPYTLEDCNQTQYTEKLRDEIMIEDRESCHFHKNDRAFTLKVVDAYNDIHTYHNVYISIEQYKTEYEYSIRYNKNSRRWDYEHFPHANIYFDWDCWVCDPKLFRLTD